MIGSKARPYRSGEPGISEKNIVSYLGDLEYSMPLCGGKNGSSSGQLFVLKIAACELPRAREPQCLSGDA